MNVRAHFNKVKKAQYLNIPNLTRWKKAQYRNIPPNKECACRPCLVGAGCFYLKVLEHLCKEGRGSKRYINKLSAIE